MTATKIVFLNGPAGSGKDDAAEHLAKHTVKTWHTSFKTPLFKLVKTIYNIDDREWDQLYTRENKNIPIAKLNGMSPREAMIYVSEELIKPVYGQDFFGQWILSEIESKEQIGFKRFVFSDSGFIDEAYPIIDKYGQDNVAVFRIYRPGYTFEGDSRNYLKEEDFEHKVKFIDFFNDTDLETYRAEMLDNFKRFVGYCD
jgi:hypothetical protein